MRRLSFTLTGHSSFKNRLPPVTPRRAVLVSGDKADVGLALVTDIAASTQPPPLVGLRCRFCRRLLVALPRHSGTPLTRDASETGVVRGEFALDCCVARDGDDGNAMRVPCFKKDATMDTAAAACLWFTGPLHPPSWVPVNLTPLSLSTCAFRCSPGAVVSDNNCCALRVLFVSACPLGRTGSPPPPPSEFLAEEATAGSIVRTRAAPDLVTEPYGGEAFKAACLISACGSRTATGPGREVLVTAVATDGVSVPSGSRATVVDFLRLASFEGFKQVLVACLGGISCTTLTAGGRWAGIATGLGFCTAVWSLPSTVAGAVQDP